MSVVLSFAVGCTTFGVATEDPSPEVDGATGSSTLDGGPAEGALPDVTPSCEGADLSADARHCGRCGHDCLGGRCRAGRCEPVQLASTTEPWYLTQDADRVYVTSRASGNRARVLAVGKASGAATELARRRGFGIIVSGDDVLFCDEGTSSLFRVAKSGGPAVVVSGPTRCLELGSHRGDLFTTLVDDGKAWNVSRAREVVQGLSKPEGIASDGTSLFVTSTEGIAIIESDASTRSRLISLRRHYPRRLAVDDSFVYWVEYEAKSVFRMTKEGGQVESFVSSPDRPVGGGIAIDGDYVYWAINTADNGGIYRAHRSTRAVETVVDAREGDGVVDLVIDDTAIYYTMQGAGRIMRVAKP